MAEISDDELGLIIWAALDYDRRLPGQLVPDKAWRALTPEWQGKISRWKNADTDVLGAEIRPKDGKR